MNDLSEIKGTNVPKTSNNAAQEQMKSLDLKDKFQFLLPEEETIMINATCEKLTSMNTKLSSLKSEDVFKALKNINSSMTNIEKWKHEFIDQCQSQKQKQYAAKLKFCTKFYFCANEKLSMDLKKLKEQYSDTQEEMNSLIVSKEELYVLQAKIKRYESELVKMEKAYPWLKDDKLKLPNIMLEVKRLERLRQECNELENELKKYRGLKPDFVEAKLQLSTHKEVYEKLDAEVYKY